LSFLMAGVIGGWGIPRSRGLGRWRRSAGGD
jgi:hypothetical protein